MRLSLLTAVAAMAISTVTSLPTNININTNTNLSPTTNPNNITLAGNGVESYSAHSNVVQKDNPVATAYFGDLGTPDIVDKVAKFVENKWHCKVEQKFGIPMSGIPRNDMGFVVNGCGAWEIWENLGQDLDIPRDMEFAVDMGGIVRGDFCPKITRSRCVDY